MRVYLLLLAAGISLKAAVGNAPSLPVRFERNIGQAETDVDYVGRYASGAVLVKHHGIVFLGAHGTVGMRFPGAVNPARIEGRERMPANSRHYTRIDGQSRVLDAPQYRKVVYRNLYPGVSLILRGDPSALEYDFLVAPGADPGEVRLAFDGIERSKIGPGGDLILHTAVGQLRHKAPIALQQTGGQAQPVQIAFRIHPTGEVGFAIGAYDVSAPLLIDPKVEWASSPLQGSIKAVAVDPHGNVFLAGNRPSNRICAIFRIFGSVFTTPCPDAFVVKLDPSGTQILYETVLAGLNQDEAASMAVDDSGNAFVLGATSSSDFPVTSGAAQSQYAGPEPLVPIQAIGAEPANGDLYIAALDASGKLVHATFLGGAGHETAKQIRVDPAGNLYVSGVTDSADFPISPRWRSGASPVRAGILAKLNPTATRVLWARYTDGDTGAPIELTPGGDFVYAAAGYTATRFSSHDGAPVGAFAVANEDESVEDLALDSQGNLWAVGRTAFERVFRADPAFAVKVKPDGSSRAFQMRFGEDGSVSRTVAVDRMDRVFVAGEATGLAMTSDALLPSPPGFLMVLNPDGTVGYASYTAPPVLALALGDLGDVYTTGGSVVTKTEFRPNAEPSSPSLRYVVNSASMSRASHISPGEMVSLFGWDLGPAAGADFQLDGGRAPVTLAGTRVLVNGVPAPLLHVDARRIDAVIPFNTPAGQMAAIEVDVGGKRSGPLAIAVEPATPELFTAAARSGQVAALNEDGSANSPANPAPRGSVISLYATGGGVFEPPLADGQIGPVPSSVLTLPVQVTFHGAPGEVLFAGSAPALLAGAIQINVRIPQNFPAGVNMDTVEVSLVVGDGVSRGWATIAVR